MSVAKGVVATAQEEKGFGRRKRGIRTGVHVKTIRRGDLQDEQFKTPKGTTSSFVHQRRMTDAKGGLKVGES